MSDAIIYDKRPVVLELEAGTYWWCACGRSKKQPWCDGSHSETDIKPVCTEIEEAKRVSMCNCKLTKNQPFCDGEHKTL